MKHIFFFVSFFLGQIVVAQTATSGQDIVEEFLAKHEVTSTQVYCRIEIATPECQILMSYRDKTTQAAVESFQISFSAPFRQAGGTEFFLKVPNTRDRFIRFTDSTVNQKVDIDNQGQELVVDSQNGQITIRDIKFGAITADLSFGRQFCILKGFRVNPINPNQKEPVEITYKFNADFRQTESHFPEGKIWSFNKNINRLPVNVQFDLTQKGILQQSFTCYHADGSVQTVKVSAPIEITATQMINRVAKSNRVTDDKGNWCQVIIPVRTMSYRIVDEKTLFVTGDPNNPSGVNWLKF